jgi:hypothetical protein
MDWLRALLAVASLAGAFRNLAYNSFISTQKDYVAFSSPRLEGEIFSSPYQCSPDSLLSPRSERRIVVSQPCLARGYPA